MVNYNRTVPNICAQKILPLGLMATPIRLGVRLELTPNCANITQLGHMDKAEIRGLCLIHLHANVLRTETLVTLHKCMK